MRTWLRPKRLYLQGRFTLGISRFPLLVLLSLLLSSNISSAQDFHYSQFFNAPLHLNPALTGIFKGDVRFMGNYRSQWSSVPVDYKTFTAAADKKFIKRTAKQGFFSGGILLNYDQAGLSSLRLIDIGLSGSYTHTFSSHYLLTFGASGRVGQRSFKPESLSTGDQFDGWRYDPNLPTNEDWSRSSLFFPDLAAGINFRMQGVDASALVDRLDARSKLDIGVGVFHLLRPNQAFVDSDKIGLPMRISPYFMGTLMLGNNIDFILNGTAQFQSTYRELIGLAGLKLHLNRNLGKQFALQLDFGYRHANGFGDAYIPGIEVFYNAWQLGFTYDVNISDFNVATQKRGGFELSLRYILRKVRPLPVFKICPLI